MTILMTPLDVPKIVPNNWDDWWQIWNTHADMLHKTVKNHNSKEGNWRGLNIYKHTKFNLSTVYSAPSYFSHPVITDLVKQVETNLPIIPFLIRVIENLEVVDPHTDQPFPKDELRCVLWNTYTDPIWKFEYDGEQRNLVLPESTNTFYYKDYPLKHSGIYDEKNTKGIMLIYGAPKQSFRTLIDHSAEKFKDFSWVI